MRPPDPVEAIYNGHCQNERHSTGPHLPRLRQYAVGCNVAVEFGTQYGAATSALLMGALSVISYDVERSPRLDALAAAAGDRLLLCQQDTRTAPVIVPCDLLFVDSAHTYAQVAAELTRHADAVTRWLIFHDAMTFGSIGADSASGAVSWLPKRGVAIPPGHYGIRLAIDELQIRDPSWRVYAHFPESHGLLVLKRCP